MANFADRVKHTLQEQVIVSIANWTVKQDRPDLCLVLYTLADKAGVLSGDSIPRKHRKFILGEFPTAFNEDAIIFFTVDVDATGEDGDE